MSASSVNAVDWKIRRGDMKAWMPVWISPTSWDATPPGRWWRSARRPRDSRLEIVSWVSSGQAYAEYVTARWTLGLSCRRNLD